MVRPVHPKEPPYAPRGQSGGDARSHFLYRGNRWPLPSGELLREAIELVDAKTGSTPVYYMVNCAHPTHFDSTLVKADWTRRIRGIRANASRCSHAELDKATELDDGNPVELGQQYRAIRDRFSHINVLGGCCGTDHRHIEQIALACRKAA